MKYIVSCRTKEGVIVPIKVTADDEESAKAEALKTTKGNVEVVSVEERRPYEGHLSPKALVQNPNKGRKSRGQQRKTFHH